MTKQFSLSYITANACPPPEMTYIAAKAGYDFVSFRTIAPFDPRFSVSAPGNILSKNKEMLLQTKKALNETGLKPLDLEVLVIYDGVDPKDYRADIETAAELGGRHLLTIVKSDERNFTIECFSELCEIAKPLGLTVDLEYVPWLSVNTLNNAVDVVRAANFENGGILIDPLHFHRSRTALEELEKVPREWFHYAQICDAPKNIPTTWEEMIHTATVERLYLGEGGIDVAALLNKLPEIPYAIEIPNVQRVKEMGLEEYARRCLQTSIEYFNLHGLY